MSVRRQLGLQLACQVFPIGLLDLLSGQVYRWELVSLSHRWDFSELLKKPSASFSCLAP